MSEENKSNEQVENEDSKVKDQEQSTSLFDALDDDSETTVSLEVKDGVKPESLDGKYWDEEKKVIKVDEMHRALTEAESRAKGLRDKLAKGVNKAPADIKEYTIEPGEKGKSLIKDGDPLIDAGKNIAKECGMPKEMFAKFMGKMADFLGEMSSKKLEPVQLSKEEMKAQLDVELSKVGENGLAITRAVNSWGKSLYESGQMSEKDYKIFQRFAQDGDDIRVLNKLRTIATGKSDIPMDAQIDGLPSDAEISEMVNKAYTSRDEKKIRAVTELLNKRREAGRPELLQA